MTRSVPQTMGDQPPPHKDVLRAVLLAVLFGPLGLFYATAWGGFVMSVLALATVAIAVGFQASLLWTISSLWLISIFWAAWAAESFNREIRTLYRRR